MEEQYIQGRYNIFSSREVPPLIWKDLETQCTSGCWSVYAGYVSRCGTQKLLLVKEYWELIKHRLLFSIACEEYVQPIIAYSAHCLWFAHKQLLSFLNLFSSSQTCLPTNHQLLWFSKVSLLLPSKQKSFTFLESTDKGNMCYLRARKKTWYMWYMLSQCKP